jgi:TetR/AcrR family transcriptional regulator, transcriptional repressor for nem operon
MRVSRAQANENRERILDTATRLFRERGIDGIGVADLMQSAGLTHGGFYGHFKSKDDLVAQACGRAMARMRENWTRVIDQAPGDPLDAMADHYLSSKHRENVGRGCLMAALGSEVARQESAVRHAVTDELRPFIDYLSKVVRGGTPGARRKKALALYASLVGALVVARAVDDPVLSDEVLQAVAGNLHHEAAERAKTGATSSLVRRHRAKSAKRSATIPVRLSKA